MKRKSIHEVIDLGLDKQAFWNRIERYLDLRVWDLCTALHQYTSLEAYQDLEHIRSLLADYCQTSDPGIEEEDYPETELEEEILLTPELVGEEYPDQELPEQDFPDVENITVYQVIKALTEDSYSYRDFSPKEAELFELLIYYPMTMELRSLGKE